MTKDPNFVSVRLPDDVANWLRDYATANNLVRADKPNMGGSIIAVVRGMMQGQTISNNVRQSSAAPDVNIQSMIDDAISKQLDDRDRVINIAINSLRESIEALAAKQEATAPANFTQALLQRAKEVAPLKLKEVA